MIVWSCGGGLQSAAIGVLIVEGVIPAPSFSGIADTSREVKSTWDYLHRILNPYLAQAGVTVEVVPHTLARVDLFDKGGLTLMPAWTAEGRLSSFCSGEWKRDVMERWLRSKGVNNCEQYIGFSVDEMHRATGKAHRPWCRPVYPLIDKMLTRGGCRRIVEAAGLPVPHKSRCWMCPHQNAEEWAEIRQDEEQWQAAIMVDEAIRENDEQHALFLHSSRVPLRMANLTVDESMPLFRACQDSGCFT